MRLIGVTHAKPVRFAVVGAGSAGSLHAKVITSLDGARLVAVASRSIERTAALAREYGVDAYTDYNVMLERDDIDVVSVCTPSGDHLGPVVAAARSGRHVVCEKPLEVTVERVDQMIAACDAAGVILAPIFNQRFLPAVQAMHDAVATGRLGRILFAEADVRWWRPQTYYDSVDWRGTWEFDGGGALMNQAIHRLDLLQWLGGPIERVCAATATIAHKRMNVEDLAVASVRFEGGALGTIVASTATWPGYPARLGLYGERGAVEVLENSVLTWRMRDADPAEEVAMRRRFPPDDGASGASDPMAIGSIGHRAQLEDMVQAVRDGHRPAVDGMDGRQAVVLVRALYESAARGEWVHLSEISGRPVVDG